MIPVLNIACALPVPRAAVRLLPPTDSSRRSCLVKMKLAATAALVLALGTVVAYVSPCCTRGPSAKDAAGPALEPVDPAPVAAQPATPSPEELVPPAKKTTFAAA